MEARKELGIIKSPDEIIRGKFAMIDGMEARWELRIIESPVKIV